MRAGGGYGNHLLECRDCGTVEEEPNREMPRKLPKAKLLRSGSRNTRGKSNAH
jgi:hypothetical protein